ncbi:MAG: LysR family transcriptional regulator [Actinomycetota bacterium]
MSGLRELDVRHLLALEAVAREGTFGRAAVSLGYTQSAVSQQIASLERLVDGRVFDRPGGPRPVELTPLGDRLLDGARDLLGRIDALDADLERFRTGEVGRLTIGTFQSASATLLPTLVARLRERHPQVEINVFESDDDEVLEDALTRGELDLSFTVGDWGDGFTTTQLLTDPFVVVARPGQFPAGPVPVSRLAEEPLIGQNPNSCQRLNEAGLRERGLDPEYVFRTNDNGTVTAMVRSGLGVAVLPLLCVEPDDPRLALHPLDPPMPDRAIGLCWRGGRSLAPVAERFVELAGELGAEVAARPMTALA